ncbi:MAG: hypothetical protein LC795_00300 [Acidobacteria bacterium]|nr:hypothetical protein [Acidobacteriota bacterium]
MTRNTFNRLGIVVTLFVLAAALIRPGSACGQGSITRMPADGWKAEPTFFASRNDDDRRRAILLWFESIKYESWEASHRRTEVRHPAGTMGEIRQYAVPGFYGIFGKRFADLSKDDKKLIAKWLKKCSKETWVTYGLVQPLTQPEHYAQVKEWAAMFERQRPPARSLGQLGAVTYVVNTRNAKALVYAQPNGVFRIELLTSVYGFTKRQSTFETTKVSSALIVAAEDGQVIKQEMGLATVTISAMSRDGEKISQNRNSIIVDTYAAKGKVYVFLNELYCRWGAWMTTLTEHENCAEVGGGRIGQTIDGMAGRFVNNELRTLRRVEAPVGQKIEHAGWVGIRIK